MGVFQQNEIKSAFVCMISQLRTAFDFVDVSDGNSRGNTGRGGSHSHVKVVGKSQAVGEKTHAAVSETAEAVCWRREQVAQWESRCP